MREISEEEARQLGAQPIQTISAEDAARLGAVPVEGPDDQPLQAGLEGALRSATFGLSDRAITGFRTGRGDNREDVKKELRERSDTTAGTVGELAGMFTPGPGLVGKVAQGVVAGVKGVTAARAVSGLVEGGLFGLSAIANEEFLSDPKLAGEHYAAGTLGGALAGAVSNVVFGKLGDLGRSALVKAFGGEELQSHLAKAASVFRERAEAQGAAKGFATEDLLAGAGALLHSGPLGVVAPFVTRAARKQGDFVAASALEALATSKTFPKLVDGFKLYVGSKLENPAFGGGFRAALETAAAKGADELMALHLANASDPEYMASVGLQVEDPTAVPEVADRARRLSQLSQAQEDAGRELDTAIGRIFGTQPGRAPKRSARPVDRQDFENLQAKLQELVATGGGERRQLSELAPTTEGLARMSVVQAAQYLLDTAPKNPTAGLPKALQRPWEPPAGELRDWYRRVDTVADPRALLNAMKDGAATAAQVETMQAVYPTLLKDIQNRMADRLATWEKPLSREKRAQVELLMGSTNDPAVTQLLQAAHQRNVQKKTGKPDGRESLDVEKNLATQAQRLEESE